MHSTTGPARHSAGRRRRKCLPTNYTQLHDTVLRRRVESALRSGIGVVDGAVDPVALPGTQRSGLTDGGLHEPGLLHAGGFPADDRPGVGVDDERDVDEDAGDEFDVGEVLCRPSEYADRSCDGAGQRRR